jgi:hypothetical protein
MCQIFCQIEQRDFYQCNVLCYINIKSRLTSSVVRLCWGCFSTDCTSEGLGSVVNPLVLSKIILSMKSLTASRTLILFLRKMFFRVTLHVDFARKLHSALIAHEVESSFLVNNQVSLKIRNKIELGKVHGSCHNLNMIRKYDIILLSAHL